MDWLAYTIEIYFLIVAEGEGLRSDGQWPSSCLCPYLVEGENVYDSSYKDTVPIGSGPYPYEFAAAAA